MPSTKSELPTIKDEELSASLDGRGNSNSSRKSSNASSINKTAFSPHEQASPQKRDNSSNGYHDSNTNYDGGTSKPASKSSSKASSPHEQSSPVQTRDSSFKVIGDTKPASRSSSKASSPHEQSSPQPRDTSFKVLGDTKPASRSSSNASSSHGQILSPNAEEVSYKINIDGGTKTNSSSSSHHELLQEERLVMLNYVFKNITLGCKPRDLCPNLLSDYARGPNPR